MPDRSTPLSRDGAFEPAVPWRPGGRPTLRRAAGALLLAALSLSLLLAPAPARAQADDSKVQLGALLITGFRAAPEESALNDGFELFEARLRAEGTVGIGLEYMVQTSFDDETRELELLDARLTLPLRPAARITLGQFKAPFSREALTSKGDLQFLNRAQGVAALAPLRQVGAQFGGAFLDDRLRYRTGLFNGEGRSAGNPDESFLYAARVEFSRVGGSMQFYDELGLDAGVSFAAGEDSAADLRGVGRFPDSPVEAAEFRGDRILWGADLHASYRGLFAAAEGVWGHFDPDPPAGAPAAGGAGDDDETAWGIAAEGGYKLWGGVVDLLARYDAFQPAGEGEVRDFLVLGANLYPGFDARFGLQYALEFAEQPGPVVPLRAARAGRAAGAGSGPGAGAPPPATAPDGEALSPGLRPGGLADGQLLFRAQIFF